jgi:hypothetical protein
VPLPPGDCWLFCLLDLYALVWRMHARTLEMFADRMVKCPHARGPELLFTTVAVHNIRSNLPDWGRAIIRPELICVELYRI